MMFFSQGITEREKMHLSLEEKQKGQGQCWDYYFFHIFLMSSMTRQRYYTYCSKLSPFGFLFKTVQPQQFCTDFTKHQGVSLECSYRVPLGNFWSRKRGLNLISCNGFYFFRFVQSAFNLCTLIVVAAFCCKVFHSSTMLHEEIFPFIEHTLLYLIPVFDTC